ncbi:ribbon-helix-helix protein, CopG family [Gemmiger sp.]|uniref:ribbon-helix-helix protein, CopG family n=1 Tax=Gemmiger formicilis TaxID=745368 RepID=UPI004025D774
MEKKLIIRPRKPAYGKTSIVSARIPDDTLKKLDSICQQTGRTRNELLVTCIEFALDNIEIRDE